MLMHAHTHLPPWRDHARMCGYNSSFSFSGSMFLRSSAVNILKPIPVLFQRWSAGLVRIAVAGGSAVYQAALADGLRQQCRFRSCAHHPSRQRQQVSNGSSNMRGLDRQLVTLTAVECIRGAAHLASAIVSKRW